MPNTGRFYAPPAAAPAYRERYMRPYSTVSPPLGGAGHVASLAAGMKGTMSSPSTYSRAPTAMRRPAPTDSDAYAAFATAYDRHVHTRPSAAYEEERRWGDAYVATHFPRPRTWSEKEEEVSVHRGAPLASVGRIRSLDESRDQHAELSTHDDSVPTLTSRAFAASASQPSALPCLASLLKRSPSDAEIHEGDDLFLTRKRAREASPPVRDDGELYAKETRRFYDEDVYTHRRVPVDYDGDVWVEAAPTQAPRSIRQDVPLKNSGAYADAVNVRPPVTRLTQQRQPPLSTQEFPKTSRHQFVPGQRTLPPDAIKRWRRSHVDQAGVSYEEPYRGHDLQRRSFHSPRDQHVASSRVTLNSPQPTAVVRDRFSPIGRFSDSKAADCVIEAAADLVEERSPNKRESITKLLLRSKEFLKAKSLVRNRNNEIDWVATFLNVGFESNSIYSLMCPLRKGRWKVEEEKYTMALLRLIESGVIRLRHGQSIRGFIAKKLHSDDMRVLKKLSNCKMFHFARLINPLMSNEEEIDESIPNVRASLERLEKLKAEFLRSVQLEALVAVRKYLSDTSIRDLLNARD